MPIEESPVPTPAQMTALLAGFHIAGAVCGGQARRGDSARGRARTLLAGGFGQLPDGTDPDALAVTLLATLQGTLLLAQVQWGRLSAGKGGRHPPPARPKQPPSLFRRQRSARALDPMRLCPSVGRARPVGRRSTRFPGYPAIRPLGPVAVIGVGAARSGNFKIIVQSGPWSFASER